MKESLAKAIFSFKTKILNPRLHKLYQRTEANLLAEDLSAFNFKKRQALFQHAMGHSKFYKGKYANLSMAETGLQSPQDFLLLPPLTREDLGENFESIKADNVASSQYYKVSTSGSTSAPVAVLHDKRHPETPIRWRILQFWGVKPWENQAFIYRFKKPFWERVMNAIMWWPTKRIFLAAANPSIMELERFVWNFNKIKPTLLQGYVDVVYEFALYLLDNNIKIHPPKMVWVTSAPLFEEQRELMEKAFGAPVCDQYGNTEIMLIAAECPEQNGLHMMQDTVFIEFVDKNNQPVPPNTTGKILLTDLTNYAFPIIRYEIGDEGQYRDHMCSCGSSLPLMDNVRGRQSMNIETPSGLQIKGEHLMAMFKGFMKYFKELQLVQEADYSVTLVYIPRDIRKAKDAVHKMQSSLEKRARHEIKVSISDKQCIIRKNVKSPLIVNKLHVNQNN